MYKNYIKEKFPHDERNGLYRAPQLPAVKLGKILMKDRRIPSPNDVLAMAIDDGIFSSSVVIFTAEGCYYANGDFLLEDVKEVQLNGKDLTVFANQKTQLIPHKFKVANEQVANVLKKVLEGASRFDAKAESLMKKNYEGFSTTELDWLNMRDEVMLTIDMLYDRYNEGKLSMMEYEEKKAELLSRL